MGYKIEIFTHNNKLPDNNWYVFSKHLRSMPQGDSIEKKSTFRGANFSVYTDPSFHSLSGFFKSHCTYFRQSPFEMISNYQYLLSWWRHEMEAFSALLAICVENAPITGEFPTQRPVTRNFDVFLDLRLNKRLSKQSEGWWFETPAHPLWRHRTVAYLFAWEAQAPFSITWLNSPSPNHPTLPPPPLSCEWLLVAVFN